MKFRKFSFLTFLLLSALSLSSLVWGAGYEKAVFWSGESIGKAGAMASSVRGADSLYFNPAGLAHTGEAGKGEFSANFSPTQAQFKGPITRSNEELEGKKTFIPVVGVLGSYQLNDKVGFGLGVYTAGGSVVTFENVDYSGVSAAFDTLKPKIENDLKLIEIGPGIGYKVNENLSLGLTYRISIVRAEFASAGVSSSAVLVASELKDLKDENFAGIRLGAQYKSDDKKWGFGINYRSRIEFKAEGTSSGYQEWNAAGGAALLAANKLALTGGGAVAVESAYPHQINLGVHFAVTETLTLFPEYGWTNYKDNKEIKLSGAPLSLATGTDLLANGASNIKQDWHDMHIFRLGAEYTGMESFALRGGYLYNSKVTDKNHARATFLSPGAGHTLGLGLGADFKDKTIHADGGVEYSWNKGSGQTTDGITGEFKAHAIALHLTGKYYF